MPKYKKTKHLDWIPSWCDRFFSPRWWRALIHSTWPWWIGRNRTPQMAVCHWPQDTLHTLQHIYYPSGAQHTHVDWVPDACPSVMSVCCCSVHYGLLYVEMDTQLSLFLNVEGAADATSICKPVDASTYSRLDNTHISQAALSEGGGCDRTVEVEEVAEHAHSPRCRVSHFTVRWARTPAGAKNTLGETVIEEEGAVVFCGQGPRNNTLTLLSAFRETMMRIERKKPISGRISICIHTLHVYVRARRRVCVSVCYVILSRPQLLSHTQQACWGAQLTGPLLPVSVFLHPLFLHSPFSPHFPLIELAQYGFLISAGLLCKLVRFFPPVLLQHSQVTTSHSPAVRMNEVWIMYFPSR